MKPRRTITSVVLLCTLSAFPGWGGSDALTGRPERPVRAALTPEGCQGKVCPGALFFSQIQDSLGIQNTIGRVSDASLPSSDTIPEFILIQDVHHHPEVQSHISSLILLGYQRWGVKKVFLEGAFARVDLSLFHRVPQATRALLLNRLVTEGNLSGPELAAVLVSEEEWSNPPVSPFQLIGMEDPGLYGKNMAAFREVQDRREQGLEELTAIRRLQNSLQIQQGEILAQQLDRTEALLRLKLTPLEYEEFLQNKAAVPSSPRLDPAIAAAERFYRLAQARSAVFLKEAEKKVPASSGPRLLVVGGFHTTVMAQTLREAGRTYIVISPAVSQSGFEPLYEKKIMESVSALEY